MQLPAAYKGIICGLCGNMDDNGGNDPHVSNWGLATFKGGFPGQWFDSWVVENPMVHER